MPHFGQQTPASIAGGINPAQRAQQGAGVGVGGARPQLPQPPPPLPQTLPPFAPQGGSLQTGGFTGGPGSPFGGGLLTQGAFGGGGQPQDPGQQMAMLAAILGGQGGFQAPQGVAPQPQGFANQAITPASPFANVAQILQQPQRGPQQPAPFLNAGRRFS